MKVTKTLIISYLLLVFVIFELDQSQSFVLPRPMKYANFRAIVLERYQTCLVTYQHKISSMNLQLSNPTSQQARFSVRFCDWLASRKFMEEIFQIVGHVTSLIPCKDSSLLGQPKTFVLPDFLPFTLILRPTLTHTCHALQTVH